MAGGNSQGIIIPIQAKIEGWQAQIKQIQSALNQLRVGTSLSKTLSQELKQFETMIGSLGRNLNQRLTSNSQIIGLTDKLRDVDSLIAQMGTRMSSVSFNDLDPSYITNNFKDLLSVIQTAEDELSSGMTTSFQQAISESTNLQKAFNKLGIDPSKLGMDELKQLLETKSSDLTKELETANKEIERMREDAKGLREELNNLNKLKIMSVTDTKAEAKNVIGDTSKIGTQQINTDYLKDLEQRINNVLMHGGVKLEEKLKDKRAQVDQAIKDLVNAQSVEEARKKIQELEDLFASVKAKGAFDQGIRINTITDDKLTQWIPSPSEVVAKFDAIKQALSEYSIDDRVWAKLIPNIKELLEKGQFDQLTEIISKTLRDTQAVTETEINKIKGKINELNVTVKDKEKGVMGTAAVKWNVDQGLSKYDEIIKRVQDENATLRTRVETLEKQLHIQATSSIHTVGDTLRTSGAAGIEQSTASAKAYEAQLGRVKSAEQALGKLQGVVQRWFSIYAVIRMVRQAINNVISTIKELDKTITNIAIVTNMSQEDLWGQMPQYTAMARKYAASISGVYEVSQLYYQQGLSMNKVMSLTEETLKMARISGLNYSDATNYMTNAVRSFKMEMSEASVVVDVYSSIAAKSATSVSELASAMSKTASSAQAVGASFENTTAMMAVMIEATRESAENIGSAMKSIISRYGEMKSDPSKLIDSEGEEMSFNKVDKALQTVGISIKDVNGQFRDFDDVIMELAEKWDTIDKNTQRYIATMMAGNRQQSRFLALVSSYDRLKELSEEAADSENASQLQYLKTLDSVDAKVQQLQTSIQALYVNSGLEETYKSFLDFSNRIMTTLDNISDRFGLTGVIAKITSVFVPLATLVSNLFMTIKLKFAAMQAQMTAKAKLEAANRRIIQVKNEAYSEGIYGKELNSYAKFQEAMTQKAQTEEEYRTAIGMKAASKRAKFGMGATALGLTANTIAASLDVNQNRTEKAVLTGAGNVLSGIGTWAMMGGGWTGALIGVISALPGIIEAFGMATESATEKIGRLKNNITEATNNTIKDKDELKTLQDYKSKYDELSKSQYESNEQKQKFLDLQNEIAAAYPELISRMDEEGNYVVNMTTGYEKLANARREAYKASLLTEMGATISGLNDPDYIFKEIYGRDPITSSWRFLWETGNISQLEQIEQEAISSGELQANQKKVASIFSDPNLIMRDLFPTAELNVIDKENAEFYHLESFEEGMRWNSNEDKQLVMQIYNLFMQSAKNDRDLINAQQDVVNALEADGVEITDSILKLVNNFNPEYYTQIKLRNQIPEMQSELIKGRMSSYTTQYVNLVADSSDAAFGTTSTALEKRFASEFLLDEWEKFYAENVEKVQRGQAKWEDLIPQFYKKYEEFWFNNLQIDPILSGIGDDIEEFYATLGKHTKKDIEKLFPDWETNKIQRARKEFFEQIFESDYRSLIKDYADWRNQIVTEGYNITDFSELIGPEFLETIKTLYSTIIKNEALSLGQRQRQISGLDQFLNIVATNEDINFEQRTAILEQVTSADLTSAKGVSDFIHSLEDIEGLDLETTGLLNAIIDFRKTLIINVNTELQSYIDTFGSLTTNLEKDISTVSKGMDFKTASEMAAKLGKTLSDFRFVAGKYYYDNVQDIVDYYVAENDDFLDGLKNDIEIKNASVSQLKTEPITIDWDAITSILYDPEATKEQWDNLITPYIAYFKEIGIDINQLWGNRSINDGKVVLRTRKLYELKAQYRQLGEKLSIDEIIARANGDMNVLNTYLEEINWNEVEGFTQDEVSNLIKLYINRTGDEALSFGEWLVKYYEGLYDSTAAESNKYLTSITARTQLSNGQIGSFLTTLGYKKYKASDFEGQARSKFGISSAADAEMQRLADEANAAYDQELIQLIASGNIDDLPEELREYAQLIYDTFHQTQKNVADAMFKAAEGGDTKIFTTDKNIEVIRSFARRGWISGIDKNNEKEIADIAIGQAYEFNLEALAQNEEEFYKWLEESNLNHEEQLAYVRKYNELKFPKLKSRDAALEIAEKDILTLEELQNLMTSMGIQDVNVEEWAKQHGLRVNDFGEYIIEDNDKWLAFLQTAVAQEKEGSKEWKLAKARLESANRTARNKNKLDVSKAVKDVIEHYQSFSEEEYLTLQTALIEDGSWDELSKYIAISQDGTYKIKLNDLKTLIEEGKIKVSDETKELLYSTIDSTIDNTISFIKETSSLVGIGTTSEADKRKVQKRFEALQEEGYLSTNFDTNSIFTYDEATRTYKLNEDAWIAYYAAEAKRIEAIDGNAKVLEKIAAEQIDISSFLSATNRGKGSLAYATLEAQLKTWYVTSHAGQQMNDALIGYYMAIIEAGGDDAVQLLQTIASSAGTELTAEDISNVYRARVNRLIAAADKIDSLVIGSRIDTTDELFNALLEIGAVDKNGVILAVDNMAAAYKALYDQMKNTAEKTTADLNSTYAKYLTATEQGDIDAISIMEDAMGLSYEALGEILAKQGIALEDWLNDSANANMFEKIGNGKIRITNFSAFAAQRGWVPGSEEYTKAFNAYNEAIVGLDRQTEKNILEEVKSIGDARLGGKVNVTYLSKALNLAAGEVIELTGARIVDGILEIDADADLYTVINEVKSLAQNNNLLIPSELEELSNAIQDMLSNIVNLIKKGINGTLTNVETGQLQSWASHYGIELDFTRTTEGFKLSQNSAEKLYDQLVQIDTISAKIVLDELNNSIDDSITGTRALKREIQELRATTESEDFKFMDKAIPSGQNNPLNYLGASGWSHAFEVIREAGTKKGLMAYEDFYNIMTEMGNLAELSGEQVAAGAGRYVTDAESAAALIEEGAKYLTIAADGSVKVDLSKFGANFLVGSQEMRNDVGKGIKEVAKAQVEILDGMIKFLETIVAMEDLKLADNDEDGLLDLDEIFNFGVKDNGYTSNFIEARDSIITAGKNNEELQNTLRSIIVDGISMWDILQADAEDLTDAQIKAIQAWYAASQSQDFDINDPTSWQSVLAGYGLTNTTLELDNNRKLIFHDGMTFIMDEQGVQYGNKHYQGPDAVEKAAKAAKTDSISALDGFKRSQNEYGQTSYEISDGFYITVDYDIETGYSAWIGSNYITADTPEALGTGIRHYALVNEIDLSAALEDTNENGTSSYTIHQGESEVTVEIDLKTKQIVVNSDDKELQAAYENTKTELGIVVQEVEENPVVINVQNEEAINAVKEVENELQKLKEAAGSIIIGINEKTQEDELTNNKIDTNIGAIGAQNTTNQLQLDKVSPMLEKILQTEKENFEQMKLDQHEEQISFDAQKLDNVIEPFILGEKINFINKNESGYFSILEDGTKVIADSIEELKWGLAEEQQARGQIPIEDIWDLNYQVPETGIKYKVIDNNQRTADHEWYIKDGLLGKLYHQQDGFTPGKFKDSPMFYRTAQRWFKQDKHEMIVSANSEEAEKTIDDLQNRASQPVTFNLDTSDAIGNIEQVKALLASLASSAVATLAPVLSNASNILSSKPSSNSQPSTTGPAHAQGTLMGELGPELVVSNGRYFVAGQNGAEFVDLDTDAIVFNHLQTKSLLSKGMSSSRGKAVTNEKNAVAFAHGNVNGGPAQASARQALAALRQLRAQWQAIADMDMASLANLGGGGGGGGGDKSDPKAFVKELEIWYNWLQRIAVLEQKITYEQQKRQKIQSDMYAHGQDYARSNMETLAYLREQAVVSKSLYDSQQAYFEKRRAEMNAASNPFSALYTFDEYGQLKYQNGAFQQLANISSRDKLTGQGNYTAADQYAKLVSMGFEKYMQYDSNGNKIDTSQEDWQVTAVQAFWDKMDADKEEMQSLHDSIEEHKKAVLEKQEAANQIMREIEDNQISVEDKVLKAIVDTRQREIDELQKQRDAIEEASKNLIDGLSEQLNKEKEMYSSQQNQDELSKLQRQLGILQRSGGSASQIANLQREIGQKQQDAYFEAQQKQIDALQEASDNELQRLDNQIELMKETLEYEKENGLLWGQVYEVMAGTPEQITAFIMKHDSEFWGQSPTKDTQTYRETLFEAQQFKEYQAQMKDGFDGLVAAFKDEAIAKAAREEAAKANANTSNGEGVNTGGTNTSNTGNSGDGNSGTKGSAGNKTNSNPDDFLNAAMKGVQQGAKITSWDVVANSNGAYGIVQVTGLNGRFRTREDAEAYVDKMNLFTLSQKLEDRGFDGTDAANAAKGVLDYVKARAKTKEQNYSKYAEGGLVDYTGPAWVDGTKTRPESVLTPEQTSILRNDILSNKPTSLLSLLTDFRDAYNSIPNASDYNSITNNDGVTIEQAIVEMHVSKIANDYDAQRAGENALEKMVQIARKTQGQRIGR